MCGNFGLLLLLQNEKTGCAGTQWEVFDGLKLLNLMHILEQQAAGISLTVQEALHFNCAKASSSLISFRIPCGGRMALRYMYPALSQLLRSEEGKQQALLAAAGQQTALAVAQQQAAHFSLSLTECVQ
jgi:hypothetical protein